MLIDIAHRRRKTSNALDTLVVSEQECFQWTSERLVTTRRIAEVSWQRIPSHWSSDSKGPTTKWAGFLSCTAFVLLCSDVLPCMLYCTAWISCMVFVLSVFFQQNTQCDWQQFKYKGYYLLTYFFMTCQEFLLNKVHFRRTINAPTLSVTTKRLYVLLFLMSFSYDKIY